MVPKWSQAFAWLYAWQLGTAVDGVDDTWGQMSTYWRFQVTGDKISRIDTGQARA